MWKGSNQKLITDLKTGAELDFCVHETRVACLLYAAADAISQLEREKAALSAVREDLEKERNGRAR